MGSQVTHEDAAAMLAAAKQGQRATVADELDSHVGYYERAASDIAQALEYVEDTGTEAAVALRATQRTMSSVATSLRRRAAELRGDDNASRLSLDGITLAPPEVE